MSLMAVPSVLPDSNIPASMVAKRFDHARDYRPSQQALAHRYHNGEHLAYGLAGMRYWGYVQQRRGRWGYGLSGLGQDSTDLTTVDANGNIIDMSGNVIGNIDTTPVYTTTLPSGQTAAGPSQQQLINSLLAAGIDVAKLAIIQPGTAQAGGSIIRQSPGLPVQPIATSTQTGLNVGANVSTGAAVAGSTVAIIGLGIVALMMMSSNRRS